MGAPARAPVGHAGVGRLTLLLAAVATAVRGQDLVGNEPPPGVPDSWDIAVIISPDAACMERSEELLLMDGGCYSNKYSNFSKAFMVKLTAYGAGGQDWAADLTEYDDNCQIQVASPTRSITLGACERFAGSVRAQLRAQLRSSRCSGLDCSKLPVGVQTYYDEPGCVGPAVTSMTYRVPLRGECLRYRNGTQTYLVDSMYNNISRIDFPDSDTCYNQPFPEGLQYQAYVINDGCYPLYPDRPPRSFRWSVQRVGAGASAVSASRRSALHVAVAAALWLVLAASPRRLGPNDADRDCR